LTLNPNLPETFQHGSSTPALSCALPDAHPDINPDDSCALAAAQNPIAASSSSAQGSGPQTYMKLLVQAQMKTASFVRDVSSEQRRGDGGDYGLQ
jgi:hypothetical protein